jgi:hypothetical protein
MMDKEKIEKRILEEYDNFVFQGYSTEEISYMGKCLQRWAIEKRVGPANIKPESSEIKPESSEEFWLGVRNIPLQSNYITLMAVHGALCLALRHPQFRGSSRQFVVAFTKSLGEWLAHAGALTPAQLREAERLEAREGSPDLE